MTTETVTAMDSDEDIIGTAIAEAFAAARAKARPIGTLYQRDYVVGLENALRELIALKDLKDRDGKTEEYERRQPNAWEAARASLAIRKGEK